MNRKWAVVGGAGLGAFLMYLFDPDRGSRRRAVVRDKIIHLRHATGDTLDVTARNVVHRANGLIARARSLFAPGCVSDAVLSERVRSTIGHVCSHPCAIKVTVRDGRVTLTGPALASEIHGLFKRVSRVRGVAGVENELEAHEEIGSGPGLPSGRVEPTASVH
jgi:hypothetical protein